MLPSKRNDHAHLARLLARHEDPSVVEREATFERVMASVDAGRTGRTRWWASLALAGSAALVLAVQFTTAPAPKLAARAVDDAFSARGEGPPRSELTLHCVPTRAEGACKRGDELAFEAQPATGREYFAAFARRPDGTILWYWPEPGGVSVSLTNQADALLPKAAHLGDEHVAGRYDVYAVFSKGPLSRAEIKQGLDASFHSDGSFEVVSQPWLVEEGR